MTGKKKIITDSGIDIKNVYSASDVLSDKDELPGEFPFLNGAYREMYLEPIREVESFEKNGEGGRARPPGAPDRKIPQAEEPTRLFSGLMLAEDTNERFH